MTKFSKISKEKASRNTQILAREMNSQFCKEDIPKAERVGNSLFTLITSQKSYKSHNEKSWHPFWPRELGHPWEQPRLCLCSACSAPLLPTFVVPLPSDLRCGDGAALKISFISASPASCPSRRPRETVSESKNMGKLIGVLLPSFFCSYWV